MDYSFYPQAVQTSPSLKYLVAPRLALGSGASLFHFLGRRGFPASIDTRDQEVPSHFD
jgi:hypothetical protein